MTIMFPDGTFSDIAGVQSMAPTSSTSPNLVITLSNGTVITYQCNSIAELLKYYDAINTGLVAGVDHVILESDGVASFVAVFPASPTVITAGSGIIVYGANFRPNAQPMLVGAAKCAKYPVYINSTQLVIIAPANAGGDYSLTYTDGRGAVGSGAIKVRY